MFRQPKNWYEKERDIESRLTDAKRKKELYEKEAEIKDIKKSMRWKPQTTKVITVYLFILMNIILVYSMWAMIRLEDLSYLGVLITDICAQVVTYFIYSVKSFSETKEEEKIKLERDKLQLNNFDETNKDESDEDESVDEDLIIINLQNDNSDNNDE